MVILSYKRFFKSVVKGGLLLAMSLSASTVSAQKKTKVITNKKVDTGFKMIIAGRYDKSGLHEWLFGKHYRREWTTPITVPVLNLDTLDEDGLTPYKAGGGRQSKSLHLKDSDGREYVLRSLDKSFGRALNPIYRGTFIEKLVDDQVTIGHPYSALTIPSMAEAAKVYHTNPIIGYVPSQPGLDSFIGKFGNYAYLLEQRPDENWETADNFGNAEKIIGTDKMLEKLLNSHHHHIDQLQYVRSRLFDMFIGDWGRHEDQWRWGVFNESDEKIYKAIPRDRDQAYSVFDGFFPKAVLRSANLDHLQSMSDDIKDLKIYGYTARHLDRRCANEATLQQWRDIAKDMQAALTDKVIEDAVKQMPPEVYPISGPKITGMLKSRRGHLVEYAEGYYAFLARHVDVAGSKENEHFEVKRLNDNETIVNVYALDKNGVSQAKPYYSRAFKTTETKDIRLYGISGNDRFTVSGRVNDGIKVRLIGGPDKDSIVDNSSVAGTQHKTKIYDNWDNDLVLSKESDVHLSNDSEVHAYDYKEYEYHVRGIKTGVSYDNPDRYFASVGYGFARHRWRKDPYGFAQSLSLRYSFTQNAFSLLYEGKFYQVFGKWNLIMSANYDAIRWTNFFGLGNDTRQINSDMDFYRLRTNELLGSARLNRTFGKRRHHHVDVTGTFQAIEIINDPGRLVSEIYTPNQLYYFDHHNYLGARVGYTYQDVDSRAVPQKGIMFYAGAAYANNLDQTEKAFTTYNSILQLYIPLIKKFSISTRTGGTHVVGTPEFYQYASVGGPMSIRGFVRDRFWGNTAFYNSNELRYITDFKGYLMNGKVGVLALYDNGRVWFEKETSNTWHHAYGGGLLLAPFNKFTFMVTYAQSDERGMVQLKLNKLL
ncbi:MAG: hypothetical protein V4649_13855 [Bacteroidota bacterium]